MKTRMNRVVASTTAIVVIGATGVHGQVRPHADQSDARDTVISEMGLADGELVAIDVSEIGIGSPFQITIPAGARDESIAVRFSPKDVRAPGYQLVEDRGRDGLFSVDPGPARTVAGESPDLPGATIRGSMLDDGLHAVFRWPDGRIQWIEPAGRLAPGVHPDLHVFCDNDAIPPSGGVCGTPSPVLGRGVEGPPPPVDLMLGSDLFCAELACDADWEYYQDYGSNSVTVQNRIELILNTCNAQYVSQTSIRHDITQTLVRTTSSEPYTSNEATTPLCQFITEWTNNQQGVPRDVAHLFTGRSINGDPQWGDDILSVFIDWNADEDFGDAGEEVATGTGVGPYTLDVVVPAGQPEGDTRMRIRLHDGGFDGMDPCGTATYGEGEDYTIRVEAGSPPCVGDINDDGEDNAADLGLLIGAGGGCAGGCAEDLNNDGDVDAADLGLLIGAWGGCP